MLPDGRRLGPHLALGHGMVRAARRAIEIGASAVQVFVDNPTAWRRRASLPGELPRFREMLATADVAPIAIHAAYLINLAGPDEDVFERSCAVLATELVVGVAYGAAYVNVHTGSHRGTGPAMGARRLAAGAVQALADARAAAGPDAILPRLVFENASGGGFALGASVDELALIDAELRDAGVSRDAVGWCLDAAHAWGAGIDVGDPATVDRLLADLDRCLGLDRLVLVHLNDTRSELGSRTDRHEHLGAGRIGEPGLRRLLTHPSLIHATTILETPGMDEGYDAIALQRARDLAAGRPLDPLPAAAFATPSARSRSAPADEPDTPTATTPSRR